MNDQKKIAKLYSALESMEGSLGGGGGFEGFYGSVTAHGVTRVFASMGQHCQFDRSSFLVDVGGGLGRPLVHALVQPGLENAVGLEVDEIKCLKSESVIRHALGVAKELSGRDKCCEPRVLHKDVEKVNGTGTLDPATHAYTFWEGIPARARTAFGELFSKSSTLCCIAIVQRAIRRQTPEQYMESLNFGALNLVDTLSGIHMSGSNRSFKAYVFERASALGPPYKGPADLKLDAQLRAPRLLQASLPRMLRSQRCHTATSAAAEPVYGKAGKNSAGHNVRVTLQDTLQPSAPAQRPSASSKRSQKQTKPKGDSEENGVAENSLGKVQSAKEAAAVSAVEVADIGRTLKPADLNISTGSTSPSATVLPTQDKDARGSRRLRRAATTQAVKMHPQHRKKGMSQCDMTSAGDPIQASSNENMALKQISDSSLQAVQCAQTPSSPSKRNALLQQGSPAKKLCSPCKAV